MYLIERFATREDYKKAKENAFFVVIVTDLSLHQCVTGCDRVLEAHHYVLHLQAHGLHLHWPPDDLQPHLSETCEKSNR